MTSTVTTCWIDRACEHEFLGLLECYLEALVRLDVLARAPTVRRVRGAPEEERAFSYELSWREELGRQRAGQHPVVRGFRRQLDRLCLRQRLSREDAPALPAVASRADPRSAG